VRRMGTIFAAHKCRASAGSSRRGACKEAVRRYVYGLEPRSCGPRMPSARSSRNRPAPNVAMAANDPAASPAPTTATMKPATINRAAMRDYLIGSIGMPPSSRCSQKSTGARSLRSCHPLHKLRDLLFQSSVLELLIGLEHLDRRLVEIGDEEFRQPVGRGLRFLAKQDRG